MHNATSRVCTGHDHAPFGWFKVVGVEDTDRASAALLDQNGGVRVRLIIEDHESLAEILSIPGRASEEQYRPEAGRQIRGQSVFSDRKAVDHQKSELGWPVRPVSCHVVTVQNDPVHKCPRVIMAQVFNRNDTLAEMAGWKAEGHDVSVGVAGKDSSPAVVHPTTRARARRLVASAVTRATLAPVDTNRVTRSISSLPMF